jgi:membrane protease YdiL (CAAX protease family)
LWSSLARNFGVTCYVFWLVRRKYGQTAGDLGLSGRSVWSHVKTGVLGYVAVIPPLLVCFTVLAVVLRFFSVEPEPQSVVQIYLRDSAPNYLLGLTLFVAVLGPVMEEIFFRGFAYAGLRRRFGVWPGVFMSAALFAALHMHWVAFFPILFLGIFLAMLYESSGSLIPSITAHALHNTAMVLVMMGFRSLSSG